MKTLFLLSFCLFYTFSWGQDQPSVRVKNYKVCFEGCIELKSKKERRNCMKACQVHLKGSNSEIKDMKTKEGTSTHAPNLSDYQACISFCSQIIDKKDRQICMKGCKSISSDFTKKN